LRQKTFKFWSFESKSIQILVFWVTKHSNFGVLSQKHSKFGLLGQKAFKFWSFEPKSIQILKFWGKKHSNFGVLSQKTFKFWSFESENIQILEFWVKKTFKFWSFESKNIQILKFWVKKHSRIIYSIIKSFQIISRTDDFTINCKQYLLHLWCATWIWWSHQSHNRYIRASRRRGGRVKGKLSRTYRCLLTLCLFFYFLSLSLYFAKYFVSCVCSELTCVNKLCSRKSLSLSLPILGGEFNPKNILYYKYRTLYIFSVYKLFICSFTCVHITIYWFISISLTHSLPVLWFILIQNYLIWIF